MSDTYIIEVRSQATGIVVRDREGYRFFAASHRFNPIDGSAQTIRDMRRPLSPKSVDETATRRVFERESKRFVFVAIGAANLADAA